MAFFVYESIDENGVRDVGIINIADKEEAEKYLSARTQKILRLDEIKHVAEEETAKQSPPERSDLEKFFARFLVGKSQIEQSLQQLAALLEGGVPILNAMRIVAEQSPSFLGSAYSSAGLRLMEGGKVAEIMGREMPFLGEEAIGMIAAGEANGDIDRMCRYAAELMSKRRGVKGNILQAMAYPVVVILVTAGVVFFLMNNVIPKIMKFLEGRSGSLPPITQSLIDVTHFLEKYGIWILISPPILIMLLSLLRRNPETAPRIDYIFLRLPVIGKALSASANSLWTRTLGILLGSGIGIVDALQFTENTQSNRYYRRELNLVRQLVCRGHPLSLAVKASGLRRLAPMAEAMIMVGENTGRMDEGLHKIADFSEQQLRQRISLLSKMIEPALFVVVGGIVGFVYIAFFLGLMAASAGR